MYEMHSKIVQDYNKKKQSIVSCFSHLVQDLNLVVGQVEQDQPAESAESSFPHRSDVAVLQRQVCEVRGVCERPCKKLLHVISSQVEFHCYLRDIQRAA